MTLYWRSREFRSSVSQCSVPDGGYLFKGTAAEQEEENQPQQPLHCTTDCIRSSSGLVFTPIMPSEYIKYSTVSWCTVNCEFWSYKSWVLFQQHPVSHSQLQTAVEYLTASLEQFAQRWECFSFTFTHFTSQWVKPVTFCLYTCLSNLSVSTCFNNTSSSDRVCLPVVVRADPLALDLSGGGVGDQAQILQLT